MQPVSHIAAYYAHLARPPLGRPRKIDDFADEAKALRDDGLSLRQIGAALGLAPESVRRAISATKP